MTIDRFSYPAKLIFIFAGLSLASIVYTYTRPLALHLSLEMSASSLSTAQLFYDVGSGFNEADSATAKVTSNSLSDFQELSFTLPRKTIWHLRFDPLVNEGKVVVRHIAIKNHKSVIKAIHLSQVTPLNQIAARAEHGDEIELWTTPGANDPGVNFVLDQPVKLRWVFVGQNLLRLAIINGSLLILCLLMLTAKSQLVACWVAFSAVITSINARLESIAKRLSSSRFMAVDSGAIWVYSALVLCFCMACVLDLNGSSDALYSAKYGNGAKVKTWFSEPKEVRVDEWAYVTPDILNQFFRADRFAVKDSVLGNHYVALTANIPVRHISTLFRPQFWAFFVLPVDYAYSVYWQAKAFVLVGGLFTFLLWITSSSGWALAGALWYFFSPFTQWSYSWPSALPEMIGSLCLATVCFCYLTVGRSRIWLAVCAAGFMFGAVNFAMCAYLPHMIPLMWLGLAITVAWCAAKWSEISHSEGRGLRVIALLLAALVTGGVGLVVYRQLKPAISAVAETAYPGRRVLAGGTLPAWELASHFLQWTESEKQFPAVVGNICEGSGFLWLAPLTLICLPRLSLSRFEKAALLALWFCFLMMFCWCVFPVPPLFGKLTGLNQSTGARCLAALGLANVGIVVLTAARFRRWQLTNIQSTLWHAACLLASSAAFVWVLWIANHHLNDFFGLTEVALPAAFAGVLCMLVLMGRYTLLAFLMIVPQALLFGTVNPVERGLNVFTQSDFRQFVRGHPALLQGKWLVYSKTPVRSGFIAASGCEVYTGTRYLPDIDHFRLFASRGLDLKTLNRLGYLDAEPIAPNEPTRVTEVSPVVVMWSVAPTDPLLPKLGIRYIAFDKQPSTQLTNGLEALSNHPLDGFWLFRLPRSK